MDRLGKTARPVESAKHAKHDDDHIVYVKSDPPIIPVSMDEEGAKVALQDDGITNISSPFDNVDFNKNINELKEWLAAEEL